MVYRLTGFNRSEMIFAEQSRAEQSRAFANCADFCGENKYEEYG